MVAAITAFLPARASSARLSSKVRAPYGREPAFIRARAPYGREPVFHEALALYGRSPFFTKPAPSTAGSPFFTKPAPPRRHAESQKIRARPQTSPETDAAKPGEAERKRAAARSIISPYRTGNDPPSGDRGDRGDDRYLFLCRSSLSCFLRLCLAIFLRRFFFRLPMIEPRFFESVRFTASFKIPQP